jgi:hypothetical protein
VPALDLNHADSIRFTLGGESVGQPKGLKARIQTVTVKPGPKIRQFTVVIARAQAKQVDTREFNSEAEMWAGLALLATEELARTDGVEHLAGKFGIVIALIIASAVTKQMDAMKFNTEAEMLRGLAEFAAGKLADLVLEMHEKEDSAAPYGRGGR